MKKKIIIIPVLCLILLSCTKKKDCRFIVQNNSSYNIEEFEFEEYQRQTTLVSVPAREQSDTINIRIEDPYLSISHPFLYFGPKTYSDSGRIYQAGCQLGRSYSALNEKALYYIHVANASQTTHNSGSDCTFDLNIIP